MELCPTDFVIEENLYDSDVVPQLQDENLPVEEPAVQQIITVANVHSEESQRVARWLEETDEEEENDLEDLPSSEDEEDCCLEERHDSESEQESDVGEQIIPDTPSALQPLSESSSDEDVPLANLRIYKSKSERDAIKRRFYEKFNIPAVLGCIDGTHISIVRPTENEERFFNRKHFHSRNVLIICDADLNILSVDASFGGASHDSFIWNQHPVKNHIISLLSSGENVYLLGDSGYAQREYMMTPILNADVDSPEGYYNKLHCSARNTVERAIGVLKNRWRCLLGHRVLHYHPNTAGKIMIVLMM
ncbi:unnamed protein product [Parnassius apollo]|uniref:(apollo) hypothetical protein n=1 Tax=Parnassius apollo TaxID=110799 RepID=A0A8S3XDF0_PARAO|nr:unnamed protein product [Parnassius apollo]